jgi:hypothetical protein
MATRSYPGGYHFSILNCFINSTPVFVSAVVIYKSSPMVWDYNPHMSAYGMQKDAFVPIPILGISLASKLAIGFLGGDFSVLFDAV